MGYSAISCEALSNCQLVAEAPNLAAHHIGGGLNSVLQTKAVTWLSKQWQRLAAGHAIAISQQHALGSQVR
jgi:hypothetical protein